MDKSWILVGMMGAGKSAVGRALAEMSGREFKDTDALLQIRLGRTISQIFSIYGEQTFRDHETSLLTDMRPESCVLATGGGIVLRPENWVQLRRLGTILFLDVPPETLIIRLANSKKKRPLLATDDWEDKVNSILASRLPLYRQADITIIDDGDDIAETATRAFHALQEFESR